MTALHGVRWVVARATATKFPANVISKWLQKQQRKMHDQNRLAQIARPERTCRWYNRNELNRIAISVDICFDIWFDFSHEKSRMNVGMLVAVADWWKIWKLHDAAESIYFYQAIQRQRLYHGTKFQRLILTLSCNQRAIKQWRKI